MTGDVLVPWITGAPLKPGRYLLHAETDGKPHCVAVMVPADAEDHSSHASPGVGSSVSRVHSRLNVISLAAAPTHTHSHSRLHTNKPQTAGASPAEPFASASERSLLQCTGSIHACAPVFFLVSGYAVRAVIQVGRTLLYFA